MLTREFWLHCWESRSVRAARSQQKHHRGSAKTGYCGVNVWFNHSAGGSYTLQSGDDCVLNATLTGPYADAESFAADCIGIMQLAADKDLGFKTVVFQLH